MKIVASCRKFVNDFSEWHSECENATSSRRRGSIAVLTERALTNVVFAGITTTMRILFLTILTMFSGCATHLTPDDNGPLDPSGQNLAMANYMKWEWPPYRAQDKLNITGAAGGGDWATRDRSGEIVRDTYRLKK